MASTFTDIGTELMTTGENAGTWGTKTNTNIQILEEAVNGVVSVSVASADQTLSYTDGALGDVARHAFISFTGALAGNRTITVPANEKVWIFDNQTTEAYTLTVKVSGQTGVTWGASDKGTKILYANGTDVIDTNIGSSVGGLDLNAEEFILDLDGDTSITADTDDQIDIKIGGTDQIKLVDGAIVPVTDNDIDLGTSSLEFKDAYFDGTVTSDAFAGPLTGNVTGNVSGTAATVTTAAQSNITSLGTLTTLTVDNIITNGSTIGHTSDTDLITLADGIATVAGEVSMTTLDIGGTNVTSTAAELNILDGVTSTAAELNALDGITAVVGELNALDIGSTAVGTAVASKAVILDSDKDYTGIRNLTLTGDLTVGGDDITMGTNTAGNLLVADGTNFNSIAVSSLSEISTAAADDVFLAIDTSGGGLKRIARSAVVAGLATDSAIANVVDDTTPQLGGNLDMNGADIITTSNATIDLAPNGTGTVVVRGNTNSGAIVFNCESNSHGQKVIAQPHSAGVTNVMLLPAGADSTLVSLVSTDTLTNKTLTSPKINEDVAVTSTATELNALDGITAVVGELNALDIGSTAVGTAVASKAVILDSNKDYTGIRNFTVSGELDAATGDFSGDVDVDGTLEADAITINGTAIASVLSPVAGSSSIVTTGALDTGSITSGFGAIDNGTSGIRTNTFTAETSFVPDAQDGAALGTTSLQFSDLFLADGAVIGMGDDNEVTLTHVADTGVLLNGANVIQLRDSAINIGSPADGDLDINADDEIELNSTLIDINGNVEISGTATTTGVHTFTAVPVFPNNTIETADIQDNAITLAKLAGGTDGNIISFDASGDPVAIATGSDGQVLTSTGAGSPPAFEDAAAAGISTGTAIAMAIVFG